MLIPTSITIYPDTGNAFQMVFNVPSDRDAEEYIEEMLDTILSKDFRYAGWEFD